MVQGLGCCCEPFRLLSIIVCRFAALHTGVPAAGSSTKTLLQETRKTKELLRAAMRNAPKVAVPLLVASAAPLAPSAPPAALSTAPTPPAAATALPLPPAAKGPIDVAVTEEDGEAEGAGVRAPAVRLASVVKLTMSAPAPAMAAEAAEAAGDGSHGLTPASLVGFVYDEEGDRVAREALEKVGGAGAAHPTSPPQHWLLCHMGLC